MELRDEMCRIDDGSEEESSILSASLLIAIELPAIEARTNLCFPMKLGRQGHVWESVEELIHGLLNVIDDDTSVDIDCSQEKFDALREHATQEVEKLQSNLRLVSDWKKKVANAGEQMNKMRNSYYKELLHWKEQVFRKQQADEKDDGSWRPTLAIHFDPSEYHMDDEVTRLVRDKVQLIQEECKYKMNELEEQLKTRVRALNESLVVTKMKLHRKDKMMEKLINKHGYKNEMDIREQLGAIKDASVEEITEKIERKVQRAENKVQRQLVKQKPRDVEAPNGDLLLSDSFGETIKESLADNSIVATEKKNQQAFEDVSDLSSCESSTSSCSSSLGCKLGKRPTVNSSVKGPKTRALRTSAKKEKSKEGRARSMSLDSAPKASSSTGKTEQRTCTSVCDTGTDPMLYQEAFRKITLTSQASQSDINAELLDKAMEYFEKATENKWNELAGIVSDKHGAITDEVLHKFNDEVAGAVQKVLKKSRAGVQRHRQRFFTAPATGSDDACESEVILPCSRPELMKSKANNSTTNLSIITSRKHSKHRANMINQEVQCSSADVAPTLASPPASLEQCFLQEDQPCEVQVRLLEETATDIERTLPLMLARAEKLGSMSADSLANRLLLRLTKSVGASTDHTPDHSPWMSSAQWAAPAATNALSSTGEDNGRVSMKVEDLLQRHGIPCEDSAENGGSSFGTDNNARPYFNSMRGLVGEAARMSFGTKPRLTFGSPNTRQERITDSPRTEDSPDDLALNDVFRIKSKINAVRAAPRKFALADASKAISDRFRRRPWGDMSDEVGEQLGNSQDGAFSSRSPGMADSPSFGTANHMNRALPFNERTSLGGNRSSFNERTSQGGNRASFASNFEGSGSFSRMTTERTSKERTSMDRKTMERTSLCSDCDSMADHLEDFMMEEFNDASCLDFDLQTCGAGKFKKCPPNEGMELVTPSSGHDPRSSGAGKLPGIPKRSDVRRDTPINHHEDVSPADMLVLSEADMGQANSLPDMGRTSLNDTGRSTFNLKKRLCGGVSQSPRGFAQVSTRTGSRNNSGQLDMDVQGQMVSSQSPAPASPPGQTKPRFARRFPMARAPASRGSSDK